MTVNVRTLIYSIYSYKLDSCYRLSFKVYDVIFYEFWQGFCQNLRLKF